MENALLQRHFSQFPLEVAIKLHSFASNSESINWSKKYVQLVLNLTVLASWSNKFVLLTQKMLRIWFNYFFINEKQV